AGNRLLTKSAKTRLRLIAIVSLPINHSHRSSAVHPIVSEASDQLVQRLQVHIVVRLLEWVNDDRVNPIFFAPRRPGTLALRTAFGSACNWFHGCLILSLPTAPVNCGEKRPLLH